ncbi:MAG: hypothetical protein QW795_06550 [Candidatus Bathyarchaeia archaeon]
MGDNIKRFKKYKIYPIEIKLNEKAIRSLISTGNFDGNISFLYNFDVSVEEINKFKNNYVVHLERNECYVLPIGIEIDEKMVEEGINKLSVKDLEKIINNIEVFYDRLYNRNSIVSKELYDVSFVNYYVVGIGLVSFRVGFGIFRDNVNGILNEYIIKKCEMPNNKEVRDIILEYLCSYDVKEMIEDFINKTKLKIVK